MHYPEWLCAESSATSGTRTARDIVVDALRRMEYRGYDSAGVALLDGCGGLTVRRRAGRLVNLETALDETDAADADRAARVWATPAGPRTAGPPTATRTRIATPPGRSRWCTTASSRTSPRCAASWRRPGWSSPATPTPRSPCIWSRRQYRHGATAGDFVGVGAGGAAPAGGPLHAGVRQRRRAGHDRGRPALHPAGARRRRWRDVRRLRCGRVHRTHPRRRRAGPGPGGGDHRRRLPDHRLSRQPRCASAASFHIDWDLRPPRRAATTTSCSRRSPSSPPRWPTPCSGISSTAASCSTSSGCPTRSCARSTRCSWWPAAPPTTPGCWPSTPSSTGPGCPWRWSWPASSATATRCWTAAPWWSRSRSPGRPPTRWRRCGTPRQQKAKVLAICNTNGSPDPAGVRRGALHPRRARDRRRVDQDVFGADHRQLSGRAGAGAGPRHQIPRRGGPGVPGAGSHARAGGAGAGHR